MNTKINKHIIGERVALIPVSIEHLDLLCEEETDALLWQYEESVDTDKEWVRKKFTEQMNCDYRYNFAVLNKENEVVGFSYIWIAQESRESWELGYMILPKYQKRGYCTESAGLLLEFAFHELHAHKVMGMCNCNNIASANIMENIGMKRQGVFRQEYRCQGEWVDQYYYSILDEDYEKIR